jgi:hypothetical protein
VDPPSGSLAAALWFVAGLVMILAEFGLSGLVIDPVKASYGIMDFLYAASQLAQTTMRSEIGKLELDRTFEERENINAVIIPQNLADVAGIITAATTVIGRTGDGRREAPQG